MKVFLILKFNDCPVENIKNWYHASFIFFLDLYPYEVKTNMSC